MRSRDSTSAAEKLNVRRNCIFSSLRIMPSPEKTQNFVCISELSILNGFQQWLRTQNISQQVYTSSDAMILLKVATGWNKPTLTWLRWLSWIQLMTPSFILFRYTSPEPPPKIMEQPLLWHFDNTLDLPMLCDMSLYDNVTQNVLTTLYSTL